MLFSLITMSGFVCDLLVRLNNFTNKIVQNLCFKVSKALLKFPCKQKSSPLYLPDKFGLSFESQITLSS